VGGLQCTPVTGADMRDAVCVCPQHPCYLLVLLRCHFFQGQSVSVGVSVKKSVVGLGSVFIRVHQVPLCGLHDV